MTALLELKRDVKQLSTVMNNKKRITLFGRGVRKPYLMIDATFSIAKCSCKELVCHDKRPRGTQNIEVNLLDFLRKILIES